MRTVVFLTALIAIVPAGAASTRSPELETVTVSAQRAMSPLTDAPVPVDVVDRDAMVRRNAVFAEDLLRGAAGIDIARAGGVGAFTELRMRGAEANHVLVLVDGIEINDPATGSNVDLAHLTVNGIERIEIARGPQSALWGSDAIAGVIYLDTRPPPGTHRRTFTVEGGSDDARLFAADIAGNDGRWHYGVGVSRFDTDGTNLARQGNEDDGYRNTTLSFDGGFQSDNYSIRAVARRIDADVDYDPTPFPEFLPVDGDLEQHIAYSTARLELQLATASAWQHRLSIDYFGSENEAFDEDALTNEADASKYRYGYQGDIAFSTFGLEQTLSLAIEHERERFRQRADASPFGDPNQNQHLDNTAAIGEWSASFANGVALSTSARFDDNSEFEDASSFRFAIRAPINERTITFASYGIGRKNPTFTERYGFTPDTFVGNPDLEPERSTGYSLAIEHRFGEHAGARFTYFRDRLQDEIDGFVFDADAGAFTAVNDAATSRRHGIEARSWLDFGLASLRAEYTYLEATEQDGGATVDEIRRPNHSARLSLDVYPFDRVAMQFGASYAGQRGDLDFGSFPAERVSLDDYVLLHWAARFEVSEDLALSARIENLGDADYEDVFGYATPGRSINIGLRVEL